MQESLLVLKSSEHFGVVRSSPQGILEANDAFLRIIGYTRETAPKPLTWSHFISNDQHHLTQNAQRQIEQYGAYIPFEREYLRHDGKKVQVLVAGVRYQTDPLEWVSIVIDRTESVRAAEIEQKNHQLMAHSQVVNQLAHELNNPLEVLVNLIYLLGTETGLSPEGKERVIMATMALERITTIVQNVLAANASNDPMPA